jgi:predicted PurR-regulated permease PerM
LIKNEIRISCKCPFKVIVLILYVVHRDGLVGQLRQLSANQNSQLSQLSSRLKNLEGMMEQLEQRDVTHQLDQVLNQLRDGVEGNT